MEKLDDEAAAKFISALTKSVQTLCHGFLDFHTGVEILGYINLNVDKGSKLHYVLEEKVCKNEENSTLFISNSFHAQNQKQDKGKDSESESSGSTGAHRSNSTDNGERSRVSSAISSISTALSRSHEKFPLDSTSSAKDAADMVQSRPISNTSKRKASDDLNSDIRSAKSSHMRSSPSPVSHFLSHSQSPHGRTGRTSPIDRKPSVSELRGENSSGTVLPQTAGISGDGAGDLGVNLAGSVLERVDDHSNSDLPDRGDDSDGDLEVTFIKEEYMEGEQSSCQFENSTGQFGRGTNRRASSTDNMPDASLYPISLHPSASATYVPGSQDMASAQHYGPSTSSQPGASGVRESDTFGPLGNPREMPTSAHASRYHSAFCRESLSTPLKTGSQQSHSTNCHPHTSYTGERPDVGTSSFEPQNKSWSCQKCSARRWSSRARHENLFAAHDVTGKQPGGVSWSSASR
ncbi:dentin sialophosphoprotein-like isoform X27 [Littorina saxatilis]|uniref:dentin sialophosphoprotein-like isoform X27 n=1 Tax=Littorina saxatilis TaxID=31220 RepID=UPI0038B5BD87